MPDYLQRVFMAGARTSTPAKPAIAAPPLVPPWLRPAFTPLHVVELGEQANTSAESSLAPAVAPPVPSPIRPSAPAEEAETSPRATSRVEDNLHPSTIVPETGTATVRPEPLVGRAEEVRFESDPVIRAPKGLRPEIKPSPALQRTMPQSLPIRDAMSVPAGGAVSSAPPGQPTEQLGKPGEKRPAYGNRSAVASVQASGLRSRAEPKADESQLQASEKYESHHETHEQAKQKTTSHIDGAAQVRADSAQPHPIMRLTRRLRKEQQVDKGADVYLARGEISSEAKGRDGDSRASRASAPSSAIKEPIAFEPAVRPVPVRQAAPAAVLAAFGVRQSQITIGRIDVQVNNHPAVPTGTPLARSLAPLPLDILEVRFLNRFAMKP